MATISEKKGSLTMEFVKKTAGYITGATGDYIKEIMPDSSSTLSGATSALSNITSKFRNSSILSTIRSFKKQPGFRSLSKWYLDQENEFDVSGIEELSFDGIEDSLESATSAQISELSRTADQISKTVVETSFKAMEAQLQATANITTSIDRQTAIITSGFDKTNETLNKILEVLTKNTSTLIEASVAAARVNRETSGGERLAGKGKFNFSDYKDMINENIKNSPMGLGFSLMSSFANPAMLKQMITPQEIIKQGISFGMNKFAPKFKENAGALDKAVGDVIMSSLIRLGEERNSSNQLIGSFAKIFGIDTRRKNVDTSRSALGINAIPFDTITKEAITTSIPGYLRQILIQLGGKDLVYDYRSRSFRSQNSIARDFRKISTDTENLSNMSDALKANIGDNKTSKMLFDMLVAKLGTEDSGSIMNKLGNAEEASKYISDIVKEAAVNISKENIDAFSRNFGKIYARGEEADVYNLAKRNNINRFKRTTDYIQNADNYAIDLSEIRDTFQNSLKGISEHYNSIQNQDASISPNPKKKNEGILLTGSNYTNMALYEIFRRLNVGINVYQVGSDKSRKKKFPRLGDDYLKRPLSYKPKTLQTDDESTSPIDDTGSTGPIEDTGPNELLNNEGENLSRGERLGRWGKHRGKNLLSAIVRGNPQQVRAAFGAIIHDIGSAATEGVKSGLDKVNKHFGNITGWLRYKFTGKGFNDGEQDIPDDTENSITGKIGTFLFGKADETTGKRKAGQGFLGSRIANVKSYMDSVLSMFKFNDKGEPDDINTKRKKALSAAVGAYAGLGLLGGPFGMIVGGLTGVALSTSGFAGKLKNFLFGDGTEDNPGLIKKIFSPLTKLVDNVFKGAGNLLKKYIFKPLAIIGQSIHDGILGAIKTGILDPIGRGIKSAIGFVTTPFKVAGKAFSTMFKSVREVILKPIGNIGLSIKNILIGGTDPDTGEKVPGLIGTVFKNTIGVAFSQIGKTFGNAFSSVSKKILEPVSDILFVLKEKTKEKSRDILIGHKGDPSKGEDPDYYYGGILSPISRGFQKTTGWIAEKTKTLFGSFFNLLGSGLKTLVSSPFAAIRLLNPLSDNSLFGSNFSSSINENYANTIGKETGVFGKLKQVGNFVSNLGTGKISRTSGSTAYSLAGASGNIREVKNPNTGKIELQDEDGNVIDENSIAGKLFRRRDKRAKSESARGNISKIYQDAKDKVNERIESYNEEQVVLQDSMNEELSDIATRNAEINEHTKHLDDLASDDNSLSTHDHGLHNLVQKIIDMMSSRNNTEINPSNAIISTPTINNREEKKLAEENENKSLAATISGAMISGSTADSVSDEEAAVVLDTVKGTPTKQGLISRVKDFFKLNKKKKEEKKEEKEESFLSKIFSTVGSSIGNIIKSIFTSKLGLLGIGAFLLSTEFGQKMVEWVGKGAMKLGGFLVEKLPGILSSIFSIFWPPIKTVGNAIDNKIHNTSTDSVDERLGGGNITVQSAEDHASRGLKEIATSGALEATALKVGSKAVQWGAQKAVNLGTGTVKVGSKIVGGTADIVRGGANLTGNVAALPGKTKALFTGFNEARKAGFNLKEAFQWGKLSAQGTGTNTVSRGASAVATKAGNVSTASANLSSKATNAAKGFGSKFASGANVAITTATMFDVGIDAQQTYSNARISGDYGLGNAGGFTTMPKKIRYSGMAAAGLTTLLVLGTNPAGWALLVAGIIAALAGAVASWIYGIVMEGVDENGAIVTNSTKVWGLLNGKASPDGKEDARYLYNAKESDRPLGLTKGKNYLDPEVTLGGYVTSIISNTTTYPGAEVLLYDLCNNMSYQGVPAAIYATKTSSKVVNFRAGIDSNNYNKDQVGEAPDNAGKDRTQVKFEDVNQSIVIYETEQNVIKRDPSKAFSLGDLQTLYEASKEVVDYLKNVGIINNNGSINEKLFKDLKGKGWKELERVIKEKDLYFFMKCLIYINSKIEVTFWKNLQWVEVNKDNIAAIVKSAGIETASLKETMDKAREAGADDETLNKITSSSDSNIATPATPPVPSAISTLLEKHNLTPKDKEEITSEIHNIDTGFMLSNPEYLEKWVLKHNPNDPEAKAGKISNWKTAISDKNRKADLFEKMYRYSRMFADQGLDVFNLSDYFNWNTIGKKVYNKSMMEAAYTGNSGLGITQNLTPAVALRSHFLPSEESNMGKLMNRINDGKLDSPDTAREYLYGKLGYSDNIPDKPGIWFGHIGSSGNYGTLGNVAQNILEFADPEMQLENASWGSMLKTIKTPKDDIGGDESASIAEAPKETENKDSSVSENTAQVSSPEESKVEEGGNPIDSPYKITSRFGNQEAGLRTRPHGGVDLIPANQSKQERRADIASRFYGKITKVINRFRSGGRNVSGGGNQVDITTPSGMRIINMHLKPDSIPANIKPGTEVKPGDKIGEMGTTGHSTGVHLHYEIHDPSGRKVNPEKYLHGGADISKFNSYAPAGRTSGSASIHDDYSSSGSGYDFYKSQTQMVLDSNDSFFGKLGKIASMVLDVLKRSSLGQFFGGLFEGLINKFGGSTSTDAGGGWKSEKDFPKINSQVIGMKTSHVYDLIGPSGKRVEVIDLTSGKTFNIVLRMVKGFNGQWTPVSKNDVTIITEGILHVKGDLNDPELWKKNGWTGFPGILKISNDDPTKDINIAMCFNGYPHGDIVGNVNPGIPFKSPENIEDKTKENPQALVDPVEYNEENKFPLGGHMCMYFGDSKSNIDDNPNPSELDRVYNSTAVKALESGNKAYEYTQEMKRKKEESEAGASFSTGSTSGKFTDTGDNAKTAWNYFKSKGYSDAGIAGLLGNFAVESGMNPKNIQNDFEKRLGNDEEYTQAVDSGTYKNFANDSAGYGLAQWTYPSRKKGLYEYARSKAKSIGDLQTQLDYAVREPEFKKITGILTNASDPVRATKEIMVRYEGPGVPHLDKRISSAKTYFDKFKGNIPEGEISGETNLASITQPPIADGAGGPDDQPIKSAEERYKEKYGKAAPENAYEDGMMDEESWEDYEERTNLAIEVSKERRKEKEKKAEEERQRELDKLSEEREKIRKEEKKQEAEKRRKQIEERKKNEDPSKSAEERYKERYGHEAAIHNYDLRYIDLSEVEDEEQDEYETDDEYEERMNLREEVRKEREQNKKKRDEEDRRDLEEVKKQEEEQKKKEANKATISEEPKEQRKITPEDRYKRILGKDKEGSNPKVVKGTASIHDNNKKSAVERYKEKYGYLPAENEIYLYEDDDEESQLEREELLNEAHQEIKAKRKEAQEKQREEDARWDALSPEEQEAEIKSYHEEVNKEIEEEKRQKAERQANLEDIRKQEEDELRRKEERKANLEAVRIQEEEQKKKEANKATISEEPKEQRKITPEDRYKRILGKDKEGSNPKVVKGTATPKTETIKTKNPEISKPKPVDTKKKVSSSTKPSSIRTPEIKPTPSVGTNLNQTDNIANKQPSSKVSAPAPKVPDISAAPPSIQDNGVDIRSSGASTKDTSSDTANIEAMLQQIIRELQNISGNTGASNNILGSINEKDFGVDKQVRNSIHQLSKNKVNKNTTSTYNQNNMKIINSIIRP